MKKEITVKKCAGIIVCSRFLILLIASFVCFVISSLLLLAINLVLPGLYMFLTNVFVSKLISLGIGILFNILAIKLVNGYLTRKYIVKKEILDKVEKIILVISIILYCLYIILSLSSVVFLDTYNGYSVGKIIDSYATEAGLLVMMLIEEVVMVKYLIFDLEKRINNNLGK